MSFLKGVFGGRSTPSSTITGAETIERLCDRVQSSVLLDDRRDAVRAIRSLSKKYKLEVGTQAMQILIEILQKDRNDAEICGYALDTLYNIMTSDPVGDEEQKNLPEDINIQFSEVYTKTTEHIQLLIQLLDEFDFHIRWPTVKLLNALIKNLTKKMQECILVSPMAISKLMDLLLDTREIIRNDALLLLQNLTKGHSNIQKIVAFESGFERLLEIIENEGSFDNGGIIVEDCLNLLINLLKSNASNQNFFKEGNFIKRIVRFFELNQQQQQQQQSNENDIWSDQKCKNLNLLLQVIRTLVSPTNQQQIIQSCQKAINLCGLLHRLCATLMIPGVPADVLTETINTVAEVIRGNQQNQQFFASVMAPSIPPRQILIVLLMSMINEKQPFNLRCSILYCIESYLYKNETGQSQVIDTLMPTNDNQQQQITCGQLLVGGLFNSDTISNWLCSCALSYAILDNKIQKEQLLRVQLALNTSQQQQQQQPQAISLMQQCMLYLQEYIQNLSNDVQLNATNNKFQTIVALLMFISTWLVDNRTCVAYFLSQPNNVSYLVSQISSTDTDEKFLVIQGLCAFLLGLCLLNNPDQIQAYTTEKLRDTICKRIGVEQFEDKLEHISQSEAYTKALQRPIFSYTSSIQLLYDYEFARIFKLNETLIIKALKQKDDENTNHKSFEENNQVIMQFKQLIREQDTQLNDIKKQFIEQVDLNQTLTSTLKQIEERYQLLKDQHALLKATTANAHLSQVNGGASTDNLNGISEELNNLRMENDNLRLQNNYYVNEIQKLHQHQQNANYIVSASYNEEIEMLKNTILNERTFTNELKTQLDLKNAEISHLRNQITNLQNTVAASNQHEPRIVHTSNNLSETLALEARIKELKSQLEIANEKCNEQSETISKLKREKGLSDEKYANEITNLARYEKVQSELDAYKNEKATLNKTINELNDEQENLLCLLQEMEDKCKKYVKLLKQYGCNEVKDEEDDDDNENGEQEDDNEEGKNDLT